MTVNYNPNINRDNLAIYYDAQNIKSFANNGYFLSLVSNNTITTSSVFSDGFLTKPNSIAETTLTDLGTQTSLSFVLSSKLINSSRGTIFSLYGNQVQGQNIPSTITTYTNLNSNVVSLSSSSFSTNVSPNTTIATTPTSNGNTIALSAVSYTTNVQSGVSLISITGSVGTTNAISNTSYSSNVSVNTQLTMVQSSNTQIAASQLSLHSEYPDTIISARVSNGQLYSRFQNYGTQSYQSCGDDLTNNDIFIFTISISSNTMTLYKNGIIQTSANISGITTVGNNLSIFSEYGTVNQPNFPIRSLAAYKSILTSEDVTVSTVALRQT